MNASIPTQMKAITEDGRTNCRGYMILVSNTKGISLEAARKAKATIAYPVANGTKSIKTMNTLMGRGFECVAITSSRGQVEELSLSEMENIVIPGF